MLRNRLLAFFMLFAMSALTSGCLKQPETAQGFREMAGSHPMLEVESVMIARPISSVNRALALANERCIDGSYQNNNMAAPTQYGWRTTSMTSSYTGILRGGGSGPAELEMRRKLTGAINVGAGPDGEAVAWVVTTSPASGGTRLDLYGGRMGYGELNRAMIAWAKGAPITGCPTMP